MDRVGNRIAIDPWQVYVTVQCYEARMRQLGSEPLAGLEGDRAVLASMYDQCLSTNARKHIYGIHLAAQAQQLRRLRCIRPVALVSGEILRFFGPGTGAMSRPMSCTPAARPTHSHGCGSA